MILSKIIIILLAITTIACLAKWISSQKSNWGIATIICVVAYAIMVIVVKIAKLLF